MLALDAAPALRPLNSWSSRKSVLVGLVTATVALTAPGVANAESGFNSSLSAVHNDFGSRKWYDNNLDGVDTLTGASGCTYSNGSFKLEVELNRDISAYPDAHYGYRDISNCRTGTGGAVWGDPGKGTFYDRLRIPGGTYVSARAFNIRY